VIDLAEMEIGLIEDGGYQSLARFDGPDPADPRAGGGA